MHLNADILGEYSMYLQDNNIPQGTHHYCNVGNPKAQIAKDDITPSSYTPLFDAPVEPLCNADTQYSPLSGVQHMSGFGVKHPLATTESQAAQNLYNRVNYNYNWDENGKKKFLVYPTEAYSKSLVEKVIKSYRILVAAKKIAPINNMKDTTHFNNVVNKVADYTKDVSIAVTSHLLKELFYAVRSSKDISEEILSPGFRDNPTPEQLASWNTEQARIELNQEQEDFDKKKEDCGFFCKIGNGAADFVGAAGTTAKIISIGVPVVLITGVAGLLYVVGKKIMQVDSNNVVNQYSATSRVAAKSAGVAAEGYLKSKY